MTKRRSILGVAILTAIVTTGTVAVSAGPTTGTVPDRIVGTPVTLEPGITETVNQIMARARLMPPPLLGAPREPEHELQDDRELRPAPDAPPPLSHWPPIPQTFSGTVIREPALPQTVGTSFKAFGFSESPYIPPDTAGDVGPTQIVVNVNSAIRVFDKAGVLGPMDLRFGDFWSSLQPNSVPYDPQVRYDRLSGRWFVLAIEPAVANTRIFLAVSSSSIITGSSSFTFFAFPIGTPSPADAPYACDFPTLGVDANAIYVGCNMFLWNAGTFQYSSAFVIRKSSAMVVGPLVVTGFSRLGAIGLTGPFAPRGVDNDDPTWTEGYLIGTGAESLNTIHVRRVSDPGGTPILGPNMTLSVSDTAVLTQPSAGAPTNIDTLTLRLFAASIHKNKLTGVTSLWTAHSVETDSTCTPADSGTSRRLGAKWYEIGNLTTTPTITQFGTLCTTGAGTGTNFARGFVYPTVVETGQGHMALAASYASQSEFVGVAAAGRLRTDPPGGTRAPETIVMAGLQSYLFLDNNSRNRWGDYSFTDVDPNDDQTVWTFQEYADTPPNNWAVRVIQLKAPPPPTIVTTSGPICAGGAAVPVTINGANVCTAPTCTNGLCTGGQACPEFFDPGPDTGGPGFANHISATVTGGVTVNSASIVIPASPATQRVVQVALSLNTIGTAPGTKSVTITNPDGQSKTGNSLINVVANSSPVSNAGGPYSTCQASSVVVNGTGSADPDVPCGDSVVAYEWDLNNDGTFDITGATPTVTSAQLTALGLGAGPHTIRLRVTDTHAATNTANGTMTILVDGMACSDGNACTQSDTCESGVCVGSNPVSCSAIDECHAAGVCNPGTGACSNPNAFDGTSCDDGNACTVGDICGGGACAGTTTIPAETQNVSVDADKATYSWSAAPYSTRYDVLRGELSSLPVGVTGGDESCFDDLAGPTLSDAMPPLPGTGFWYLSRGENACGIGTYGTHSDGTQRISTTCP